jgi:hypothetical protein
MVPPLPKKSSFGQARCEQFASAGGSGRAACSSTRGRFRRWLASAPRALGRSEDVFKSVHLFVLCTTPRGIRQPLVQPVSIVWKRPALRNTAASHKRTVNERYRRRSTEPASSRGLTLCWGAPPRGSHMNSHQQGRCKQPTDPVRLLFNVRGNAEFEADLIRVRTAKGCSLPRRRGGCVESSPS